MMKPHCDYCESELVGKHDPQGIPCTVCVALLKDALKQRAATIEFPLGNVAVRFPREFTNETWRGGQASWAFRSILKKVESFSKKFV